MLSCVIYLIIGFVAGISVAIWKQHAHCKYCGMEEKCEDLI